MIKRVYFYSGHKETKVYSGYRWYKSFFAKPEKVIELIWDELGKIHFDKFYRIK